MIAKTFIPRHIFSKCKFHYFPRCTSAQTTQASPDGYLQIRLFASHEDDRAPSYSKGTEWRKKQLEKLEKRFSEPSVSVDNDEDLQPMWKEMESRVTRRRPRTLSENGGKTGRQNIKPTDEEFWLREGLYAEKDPEKTS